MFPFLNSVDIKVMTIIELYVELSEKGYVYKFVKYFNSIMFDNIERKERFGVNIS